MARWVRNQQLKCDCGGYWFPHRRGGGSCRYSPSAEYWFRIQRGEDPEEVRVWWANVLLQLEANAEGTSPGR